MHPPTPALPFKGGFAFDPYVILSPLLTHTLHESTPTNINPSGKSSGPLNNTIASPLLIINSDSWSSTPSVFYGRPHFDVVHEIARHCGISEATPKQQGNPSASPSSATTAASATTSPSHEAHPKPSHSHTPAAWFLTLNHSAHPNCTDAPLIEPLLLRLATGAKINAAEGVRAYVDASEAFVRYAIGGEGWHEGILGAEELQVEQKKETKLDGAGDDNLMKKTTSKMSNVGGNDTWKVHVAPNWKRCGRQAPG